MKAVKKIKKKEKNKIPIWKISINNITKNLVEYLKKNKKSKLMLGI
jgi:hypothetical protein